MATRYPENLADSTDNPEAERHDSGVPAPRASYTAWLTLPKVTGLECVRALRQAGFVVVANVARCVELVRDDGVRVEVPLSTPLSPDVLVAILQRAGISPARFRELLDD
jgi:hypothetical protein